MKPSKIRVIENTEYIRKDIYDKLVEKYNDQCITLTATQWVNASLESALSYAAEEYQKVTAEIESEDEDE